MRLKSVHFSRQVRFPLGGKMFSHLEEGKYGCSLEYLHKIGDVVVRSIKVSFPGVDDAYVPMDAVDSFVPVVAREQETSTRKSASR